MQWLRKPNLDLTHLPGDLRAVVLNGSDNIKSCQSGGTHIV